MIINTGKRTKKPVNAALKSMSLLKKLEYKVKIRILDKCQENFRIMKLILLNFYDLTII